MCKVRVVLEDDRAGRGASSSAVTPRDLDDGASGQRLPVRMASPPSLASGHRERSDDVLVPALHIAPLWGDRVAVDGARLLVQQRQQLLQHDGRPPA